METLALIELLDRDGQPRQVVRVTQWPVRIGRAIDCDVVIDDPHVAAHHADLVLQDDGVHVQPRPSLNGVRLGRARVASGSAILPSSGLLGVGTTGVRVRLASEVLAPEQALVDQHVGGRKRAIALTVLGVLAAAWLGFDQWVASAPGESGTEAMGLYLAVPVVLALWCALWAMGSKLFQHHFAFWPHLQAALFWPLVAMAVETVAGQLAFALSAPAIAKTGHLVAVAAIAMLLWRHLAIVMPQRRHSFAWVVVALVAIGGGLDMVERSHHQQPLVGNLYLGTISLPGLRLVNPVSAEDFVKSAQGLEGGLSSWAAVKGDDSDVPDSDGEGG